MSKTETPRSHDAVESNIIDANTTRDNAETASNKTTTEEVGLLRGDDPRSVLTKLQGINASGSAQKVPESFGITPEIGFDNGTRLTTVSDATTRGAGAEPAPALDRNKVYQDFIDTSRDNSNRILRQSTIDGVKWLDANPNAIPKFDDDGLPRNRAAKKLMAATEQAVGEHSGYSMSVVQSWVKQIQEEGFEAFTERVRTLVEERDARLAKGSTASDHSAKPEAGEQGRTPSDRMLSTDDMHALWNRQVAANCGTPMCMVKGYYEARVSQVDSPNGILMSSTESQMKLSDNTTVRYADGSQLTLAAGTDLPNGVQLVPSEIQREGEKSTINGARLQVDTTDGTIRLTDGTVLKQGGTISGEFSVDKGQLVKQGSFIVARDSFHPLTGEPRIDTYMNKDLSRWQEVPGKAGVYSPAPNRMGGIPTPTVQVPEIKDGRFNVSYGGIAPIVQHDWIVPEGEGYYRVSQVDTAETYLPGDDATRIAFEESLAKMRANGADIVPAATTREEYYAQQETPRRTEEARLTPEQLAKAQSGTDALAKIMSMSYIESSAIASGEQMHNFGMTADQETVRALAQQAADGLGADIRVKYAGVEVLVKPGMTEGEIKAIHYLNQEHRRATQAFLSTIVDPQERTRAQSHYLRVTMAKFETADVKPERLFDLVKETSPEAHKLILSTQNETTKILPLSEAEIKTVHWSMLPHAIEAEPPNGGRGKYGNFNLNRWMGLEKHAHHYANIDRRLDRGDYLHRYGNRDRWLVNRDYEIDRRLSQVQGAGSQAISSAEIPIVDKTDPSRNEYFAPDHLIENELGKPRTASNGELRVDNDHVTAKDLEKLSNLASEQARSSDPAKQQEGKQTLAEIERAQQGDTHALRQVLNKSRGLALAVIGVGAVATGYKISGSPQVRNLFERLSTSSK